MQNLNQKITVFSDHLEKIGKSKNTVQKYFLELKIFDNWLNKNDFSDEQINLYKIYLLEKKYKESTISRKLVVVKKFYFYLYNTKIDILPIDLSMGSMSKIRILKTKNKI